MPHSTCSALIRDAFEFASLYASHSPFTRAQPSQHEQTYIHRIGRTARAGRTGEAYTIVREEEARHFKQMMKKATDHTLHKLNIPAGELDQYEDRLQETLTVCAKETPVERSRARRSRNYDVTLFRGGAMWISASHVHTHRM